MRKTFPVSFVGLLAAAVGWAMSASTLRAAEPAGGAAPDPAVVEFFEKKVRPVLVDNCFGCHSVQAKKAKGGLRLDSRASLLKGGDNGPAIVAGEPTKSRLIKAIHYKDVELQMPPKAKLPDVVIADLTAWVKMGAPWPAAATEARPATGTAEFDLAARKAAHWAWEPIRRVEPPAVKNLGWVRGPIDRFILAKLEEKGVTPAPAADRRTLIRRVYFDLLGLPPGAAEVEAFAADNSADAFDKLVDKLLASPAFGERWARHWLDLVRYAESRGHEFDYPLPNAWQYRDYVIRAFNADVPYDKFVVEHVAGDLLPAPRRHPTEGFNESVLGTGFWFLGEEVHSPVDTRADEADRIDNKIDVLTKTFLSLTVSCARCHDHKFDAISTKDYYALFGFAQSGAYRQVRFDTEEGHRAAARELDRLYDREHAAIIKGIVEQLRPGVERTADYLLAAAEVRKGGGDAAALRRRTDEVAAARRLDAVVLARWVEHLPVAESDPRDLVHDFARKAAGRPSARWIGVFGPPSTPPGAQVVVDYGELDAARYAGLSDGIMFGSRPARPGDLRLGADPKRPVIGAVTRAAAETDRTRDRLKLSPGTENEPGAVGGWMRSGRTIRTPTFTVAPGKLYYLVRGLGHAYAAVDNHVMIQGPLHGRLVRAIKGDPNRWQWVEHDLSPYAGRHVHVQFSPAADGDFGVAMVIQSTTSPATIAHAGADKALDRSLAEVAEFEHTTLLGYLRAVGSDDFLTDRAATATFAPIFDRFVRSAALFGVTDFKSPALDKYFAERDKVLAGIKWESRTAPAMWDGPGEDERVFIRGSHKALGEVVPRRFLEAFAGTAPLVTAAGGGSGRLQLARQMINPATNPLITRVIVNRLWHHLFGRGIVGSTDNFGVLGEKPTNRELLDYLADEFARDGWSIKRTIRTMVLTSAYRMGSAHGPRAAGAAGADPEQLDPQNHLLHRMNVRRLSGEAIRDAMLSISGRLNPKMFGAPVPVHLTAFMEGRGRPGQAGPLDGDGRRSVYISVRRNFLAPMMTAFDTPIPFSTVGKRSVSNVPAQALILLNDPLVHQQAAAWAKRVASEPGTEAERIGRMYLAAFARPPSDGEREACAEFLKTQGWLHGGKPDDPRPWADLAHALFNVKEFVFVK